MAGRQHARKSTVVRFPKAQLLTMQDWPVSYRLLAVIVLALIMGLVFGGLRVAAAVDSAAGFGRVTELATLGQQTTGLVQALEDERDETAGVIPAATSQAAAKAVRRWYAATDTAAARVKVLGSASAAPSRPTSGPGWPPCSRRSVTWTSCAARLSPVSLRWR